MERWKEDAEEHKTELTKPHRFLLLCVLKWKSYI